MTLTYQSNIKVLKYLNITGLLFCVYVYIFSPPLNFVPFGLDKLIFFLAFIILTINKSWGKMYRIFRDEFAILILITLFSLIVSISHDELNNLFFYDLFLVIELIPSAYFLFIYARKIRTNQLDRIIYNVCILASITTFYLVLNPDQAIYLKTELLKFPEDLLVKFYYRGFGFSDGLFFSYPVIQGFCIGFIALGYFKKSINIIWALLFLIAIVTNARSGFIPALLGIFISVFYNPRWFTIYTIVSILLIILLLGFAGVLINQTEVLGTSFEWGSSIFEILGDLIKGEKTENVDALFSEMLVFPETIEHWVIGSGKYLFLDDTNRNTDIGFLLRLNYGGIFYLSLFVFLSFFMAKRLFSKNKSLSLLLFVSLIYLNFKADFFIVNPASRFFFLVYVVGILDVNSFQMRQKTSIL